MLPVDFWLMCEGYSEYKNREYEFLRDIVYGASRYNAANTAFSKEAAKKISKQKFPWERKSSKEIELMDNDKIEQMINAIGKKANG